MKIQNVNNQQTFAARKVVLDANIVDLGKNVLGSVMKAVPDLLKIGDSTTDIFIKKASSQDSLSLQLGKESTNYFPPLGGHGIGVSDFVRNAEKSFIPESEKEVVSVAQSLYKGL